MKRQTASVSDEERFLWTSKIPLPSLLFAWWVPAVIIDSREAATDRGKGRDHDPCRRPEVDLRGRSLAVRGVSGIQSSDHAPVCERLVMKGPRLNVTVDCGVHHSKHYIVVGVRESNCERLWLIIKRQRAAILPIHVHNSRLL